MKIDNGLNVDLKFTKFIVLSSDDTNWDIAISKANIIKILTFANCLCVQILSLNSELSFPLSDITNQAGWTADQAGLNQATLDICSWT